MNDKPKLKVLHALGWYFPDSTGGTEVYVRGLVHRLQPLGVDSTVTAARDGLRTRRYRQDGVPVHRYPMPARLARGDREQAQARADESFEECLESFKPDIYHQHAWTAGCGLRQLYLARRRKLKTILTLHLPSLVCLRGTMMLHGQGPCDGLLREDRCGGCWGETRGLPRWLGEGLTRIPAPLSRAAGRLLPKSRLSTALAWSSLVADHAAGMRQAVGLCDRVVVLSRWMLDALLLNGFSPQKVALARQGLDLPEEGIPPRSETPSSAPLRVGFVGRWNPVKGLLVLARAIARIDAAVPLTLTVHALGDGATERPYRREVEEVAAAEPRIRLAGPLPRERIFEALAGFDVLAVPSQCQEMAPYVVLEAQAAGTPVLGSRLGGISEMVREGVDGWLLPHAPAEVWAEKLRRLAARPEIARRMASRRPQAVRSMEDVAREMAALYRAV